MLPFAGRLVSLIAGLAVATIPVAAQAAPSAAQATDAATRIDSYLRGRMPHLRVPGVSVVVVQGDQVTLTRGYGVADRATGTPMTEDTPIAIASTTKGMTALAIMQLVERGQVDLDAPVMRYLPEFTMGTPRAADITVRQVLSHTAGIPAGGFHDAAQDDRALERRIASLASTDLHFAPGDGYEYANDGFNVAGLVVQRVAGVPYEEYLAAHLFAPLGMVRTTLDVARATEWGMTGYSQSRGTISAGPVPLSRGGNPSSGVLTTARDVGHYLVALLNAGTFNGSRVITPASIDQMWTPEPASGKEAYGLGWSEMHLSGLRLIAHAGDLAGGAGYGSSGSQFLLAPDLHLGVAVLANMSSLEKAEIAQDTLAILLGGEPAVRPTPPDWRRSTVALDETAWASFVGEYQMADGTLRVYRDNDRLLGASGGIAIELIPVADTEFVMLADVSTLDEQPVEFQRQADGNVVLLFRGAPFAIKR